VSEGVFVLKNVNFFSIEPNFKRMHRNMLNEPSFNAIMIARIELIEKNGRKIFPENFGNALLFADQQAVFLYYFHFIVIIKHDYFYYLIFLSRSVLRFSTCAISLFHCCKSSPSAAGTTNADDDETSDEEIQEDKNH